MHILTGNGDVPRGECTSLLGMGMCLIKNGDVPHRECTSSPGMHIVYEGCKGQFQLVQSTVNELELYFTGMSALSLATVFTTR